MNVLAFPSGVRRTIRMTRSLKEGVAMEHEITATDLRLLPSLRCRMCQAREKTWSGDDPKCSFPNGGSFDAGGWNCATANAIRDICGQDSQHIRSDYRYCDDQNYATIKIDDVDLPSGPALALWVSWYKHRGRTEAMWLLCNEGQPRRPDALDCETIIDRFAVLFGKP